MFSEITLKNFRTHLKTTIQLKPITLLIGNNNSGKTNLLVGIQHFCGLVRRADPERSRNNATVKGEDFFPYRHRLVADDEPISMSITWKNPEERTLSKFGLIAPPGEVSYEMQLYQNQEFVENVACKEVITIKLEKSGNTKKITTGEDQPTNTLEMRKNIEESGTLEEPEKHLARLFFKRLTESFGFHFQPAFLKGKLASLQNQRLNTQGQEIGIPADLGYEGQNFLEVLLYIKEKEERTFARFLALMRRFERNFHSLRDDKDKGIIWEFDLGRPELGRLDEFPTDVLSDGFMKAAAISLLASLWNPPALIMLEEIENGTNPGNIAELISWIWQATSPNQEGFSSQFILTSHSPSVLREFNEHLDHIYTVHLRKKNFYSDVRNLNTVLDTLIGIGAVEGEKDEETGLVSIPKYQLAELWYSGMMG